MKTLYQNQNCRIYLAIVLMCLCINVSAQNTVAPTKTITIILEDALTAEPISFASIVVNDIKGNQIQVGISNLDGEHVFILPAMDDYVFKAIYVGYKQKVDTLTCQLPGCVRTHQMKMSEEEGITCGSLICCCCCCGVVIIEDSTEVVEQGQEMARVAERADEEGSIKTALNNFVCYPNPVSNDLHVDFKGNIIAELRVFNTAGICILKRNITDVDSAFVLDLSQFAQGCYYVVCSDGTLKSHTQTIIKQ